MKENGIQELAQTTTCVLMCPCHQIDNFLTTIDQISRRLQFRMLGFYYITCPWIFSRVKTEISGQDSMRQFSIIKNLQKEYILPRGLSIASSAYKKCTNPTSVKQCLL